MKYGRDYNCYRHLLCISLYIVEWDGRERESSGEGRGKGENQVETLAENLLFQELNGEKVFHLLRIPDERAVIVSGNLARGNYRRGYQQANNTFFLRRAPLWAIGKFAMTNSFLKLSPSSLPFVSFNIFPLRSFGFFFFRSGHHQKNQEESNFFALTSELSGQVKCVFLRAAERGRKRGSEFRPRQWLSCVYWGINHLKQRGGRGEVEEEKRKRCSLNALRY